jgi:hypothetical protein
MGLLDDAIRQHLDFKRLRGADPSEVAREERDALGPGPRDEDLASAEQSDASAGSSTFEESRLFDDAQPSPRCVPHTDQETAELDMRTVLEAEPTLP